MPHERRLDLDLQPADVPLSTEYLHLRRRSRRSVPARECRAEFRCRLRSGQRRGNREEEDCLHHRRQRWRRARRRRHCRHRRWRVAWSVARNSRRQRRQSCPGPERRREVLQLQVGLRRAAVDLAPPGHGRLLPVLLCLLLCHGSWRVEGRKGNYLSYIIFLLV